MTQIPLVTLLKYTPENLAEQQMIKLQEHVVNRLEEVTDLIRRGKYEKALDHLEDSPAGDCMGLESRYISFVETGINGENREPVDIGDVLDRLICLHKVAQR